MSVLIKLFVSYSKYHILIGDDIFSIKKKTRRECLKNHLSEDNFNRQ